MALSYTFNNAICFMQSVRWMPHTLLICLLYLHYWLNTWHNITGKMSLLYTFDNVQYTWCNQADKWPHIVHFYFIVTSLALRQCNVIYNREMSLICAYQYALMQYTLMPSVRQMTYTLLIFLLHLHYWLYMNRGDDITEKSFILPSGIIYNE